MPVKKYKPTSPGIRFQSHHTFDEITKTKPEKALTEGQAEDRRPQLPSAGSPRASSAAVTSRSTARSTSSRDKHGIPAKVAAIEYDPNRTARIALLNYADGEKRYILAPNGLEVGTTIIVRPGRRHPRRQLRCRSRRSPSARRFTTSS